MAGTKTSIAKIRSVRSMWQSLTAICGIEIPFLGVDGIDLLGRNVVIQIPAQISFSSPQIDAFVLNTISYVPITVKNSTQVATEFWLKRLRFLGSLLRASLVY